MILRRFIKERNRCYHFSPPLVYGNTIIYENWWDTSDVSGNISQINTVSGLSAQQGASLLQYGRGFICIYDTGLLYEISSTGTLTQINTTRPGTTNIGQGAAMVGRNNELYFFGGGSSSASNIANKYNVSTGTWTNLSDYPVQAFNVQGAYDYNTDLIFLTHNKLFYSYSPNINTYNTSLSQPLIGSLDKNSGIAGIACSSGYVYMSYSGSFKRYNISADKWEVLQNAPVTHLACRVGVYNSVSGNVIYCLYGGASAGYWIYNPSTNSYTNKNSTIPTASNQQSIFSCNAYMIITSLSNIYKIT